MYGDEGVLGSPTVGVSIDGRDVVGGNDLYLNVIDSRVKTVGRLSDESNVDGLTGKTAQIEETCRGTSIQQLIIHEGLGKAGFFGIGGGNLY